MFLHRTQDTYCGMYDFAVSGGALGAIDLQVPIPKNTMITEFGVFVLTAVTSAGAPTISWDLIRTDITPQTTIVGGLMTAQLKAIYAVSGTFANVAVVTVGAGVCIKTPNAMSIGITIAVAVLTAGKLQCWARGITYDF